jgi:hypothetical protein
MKCKHTIVLFARDPGGANTVIPLVRPLTEKGYNVRLYGKDMALGRYAEAGLPHLDILSTIDEIRPDSVEKFLCELSPDFVITGTSAEDFTEKYLWRAAGHLGIPSFAILDQWTNYGIRFSPWGLANSPAYEAAPVHPFLPTRIIVMDEWAREEMARAGVVDRTRILPLGQPYFETLLSRRDALPSAAKLRARLGLATDDFLITFVSEPLSCDYGEDPDRGEFWGFTERTIFRSLRDALGHVVPGTGRKVRLVIKLHPRETSHNYGGLVEMQLPGVVITLDRSANPLELLHASDLACGMSSMMLIEAAIIGTPVISLMIGLKRENPFILDRRGIIRSVRSGAELEERLMQTLSGNGAGLGRFEVIQQPVQAIIDEMERVLV